eukprot:CAMPEP_0204562136 /NCGR_PEP_ID=MMETSP0661-20131031/33584_1 /ASSEMBLY_ACC=CAM_ASM_000606 /TAXON_ID=109239 /ORGANISM="Alexandrium margalefi, Strain AMGDE01CS-322" /LENGTH=73 /DNA_ID=CAMNT_0051569605 /DNA_START=54 /DNA_END=271 /DNA_ORIENTATION=-
MACCSQIRLLCGDSACGGHAALYRSAAGQPRRTRHASGEAEGAGLPQPWQPQQPPLAPAPSMCVAAVNRREGA